jgi:predicted MFS family arabinose efflux permease
LLIHRVGEGVCSLINSASYSSTIFAVKAMRLPESTISKTVTGEGWRRKITRPARILREFKPFAHILMLITVISIFGVPYITLMPAMARTVLDGTSRTMGLLLMSVGAGALTGSLLMASRKSPVGLDRWAIRCAVSFGVCVSVFALSRHVWFAMAALVPVGFFMVTSFISCNTFLQTFVSDDDRSVLMSLYVGAVTGVAPIGSMLVGQLGEMFGASGALFSSGLICVAGSLVYARKLDRGRHTILRALVKRGWRLKEGRKREW